MTDRENGPPGLTPGHQRWGCPREKELFSPLPADRRYVDLPPKNQSRSRSLVADDQDLSLAFFRDSVPGTETGGEGTDILSGRVAAIEH